MTLFSKLLKYYIESSGYTIYHLSKCSGLNRTSIQKAISEDRLPQLDSLKKLEKHLNLTPDERRLFWSAYEQAFYGEALFAKRQSVRRLLVSLTYSFFQSETFSPAFRLHVGNSFLSYPDPSSLSENGYSPAAERRLYHNLYEFSSVFRSMLEDISTGDSPLSSQPVLLSFSRIPPSPIFQLLLSYLSDENGGLAIRQIIYFIKNPENSGQPSYNLDLLALYFPCLSFGQRRYEAWYSYHESLTAASSPELFPSYIVLRYQVILFSPDFHSIWVETDEELVSHFRKAFYQAQAAALPLASRFDHLLKLASQEENPEITVIFNAESLKEFIASGIPAGIPKDSRRPFSVEERYACLKQLEKDCMDGSPVILAASSSLPLSPGLSLSLDAHSVTFRFPENKGGNWNRVSISENTIVDSFRDFIDISLENGVFLSQEDLMDMVRKGLAEIEKAAI